MIFHPPGFPSQHNYAYLSPSQVCPTSQAHHLNYAPPSQFHSMSPLSVPLMSYSKAYEAHSSKPIAQQSQNWFINFGTLTCDLKLR